MVLQQNFNIEYAQTFLFFPNESMMDKYPRLLMNYGTDGTHPVVAKVQGAALSMFYILHIRDWRLTRKLEILKLSEYEKMLMQ